MCSLSTFYFAFFIGAQTFISETNMDLAAEFKKQAQDFVQELLRIVNQIDGPEAKAKTQQNIKDAGKEPVAVHNLVREITTKYAPELVTRWEDIVQLLNKGTAAARPAPAGRGGGYPAAGISGEAAAQPAQYAHNAQTPAQPLAPPGVGGRGGAPVAHSNTGAAIPSQAAHPTAVVQVSHFPQYQITDVLWPHLPYLSAIFMLN